MYSNSPQGGTRNSGTAGGRRINSTRARINATRRRCQQRSLASFQVHSKWSQTPLIRTSHSYTLWIFLTLEFAGNWYHLSIAKSANSSNSSKSRSMLRLGYKRPAGTRKFGGTSGTRAICLSPQNRKSDNKWWQQKQTTKYHRHTPQPYTIHIHNTTDTTLRTRLHNPWQQKETHHGHFHKRQIKTTQSTKTTEDKTWVKWHEKRQNRTLNRNFIFDERTYFNELDQSTPISDNYKKFRDL